MQLVRTYPKAALNALVKRGFLVMALNVAREMPALMFNVL
jgi:hypothetical protein